MNEAAVNALAVHAVTYRGGWASKHQLGMLSVEEQSQFYLWLTMKAQAIDSDNAVVVVNGALELLRNREVMAVLVQQENYRKALEAGR